LHCAMVDLAEPIHSPSNEPAAQASPNCDTNSKCIADTMENRRCLIGPSLRH
jgi:hypothetical protein